MNTLEARRRLLGRNVYKRTTEGNPAIAQGSLARRDPGIEMQGWTEQAQYEGKNLFNLDDLLSLIPEGGSDMVNVALTIKGLTPNTPYTLSATIEGDIGGDYTNRCLYIGTTNTTDSVFTGHPVSKISGDSGEILVYFYPFRDIAQDIKSGNGNVQLEEGMVPTTYEPYTGGQPSPSPDYKQDVKNAGKYNEETGKYEYGVKLTGKNLFDIESTGQSGDVFTVDNSYLRKPIASNLPDGQINISFSEYEIIEGNQTDTPAFVFVYSDGTNEENYLSWFGRGGKTSQPNKKVERVEIYNVHYQVMSITNIMIVSGTSPLPYEPYHLPQIVTLTSDRPLIKWDKLEKRNGQWGWVYKSEEIESYTDESVPGEYFSTTGQLSTGAQVWYETTTETFVPLTASEQEAMNELYTFRPTTMLSNDCGCNMTLTYKTKKSLEVTT